jgi:hypothetical protein
MKRIEDTKCNQCSEQNLEFIPQDDDLASEVVETDWFTFGTIRCKSCNASWVLQFDFSKPQPMGKV